MRSSRRRTLLCHRSLLLILCAFAVCIAQGCPTVPVKRQFNPEGVYRHSFTQLAFPEQSGSFDRMYVTEFDPDSTDVAGHYRGPTALPIVATVYHYPATAGAAAPTEEEFIAHFEQTKRDVTQTYPGVRITHSGGVVAKINSFELSGAHASFSIPDFPAYAGPADSHLYLFALDGWYLKFRFSHPAEVASDALPREHDFIESFTWPIPE